MYRTKKTKHIGASIEISWTLNYNHKDILECVQTHFLYDEYVLAGLLCICHVTDSQQLTEHVTSKGSNRVENVLY